MTDEDSVRREGGAMNKVVVRYADGRVVKGTTADFFPGRETFHVNLASAAPGTAPVEVRVKDLKAVFFVRDYAGNPSHVEKKAFDPSRPQVGRRIQVLFNDGEIMVGTTQGYQPGRPGFFVVPADPETNTERCYVVSASAKEVRFL
jgi:hypothetical protein